jgi:soluble lytic murein transglycosylase-like protein
MRISAAFFFSSIVACAVTINIPQVGASSVYDGLIAAQAEANGVPVSLIHRVIMRESRYNPRAVSGGNYGLMQIRLGTARAMGYRGSAEGLLDPATNLTYAVRYLAGAYRAARGNESRAAALYVRGYYGEAKRRGFSPYGSSQ